MRTNLFALLGTAIAVSAVASTGCNLSTTVGSNETGGSGGNVPTSNGSTTSADASTTTQASGTGTQTTGSQTSAQTTGSQTTSTTVSTGSGNPTIQGAHVYVAMDTDLDWIQDMTLVEIRASATAVDTEFKIADPAGCAANDIPIVASPPPPTWIDLSAVVVTVTAQGFGSVQGTWSANDGTIYAQFNGALPAATPIHIAFDATSPLFPGQSFDYATQNIGLNSPQLTQIFTYPNGSNWAFAWSGVPMPYALYTFVVVTNPPNPPPTDRWVATCSGDSTASGVTIPSTVMSPIVADLAVEPQPCQIWLSLALLDKGAQDEAVSGNFLSHGSWVHLARPVVVGN